MSKGRLMFVVAFSTTSMLLLSQAQALPAAMALNGGSGTDTSLHGGSGNDPGKGIRIRVHQDTGVVEVSEDGANWSVTEVLQANEAGARVEKAQWAYDNCGRRYQVECEPVDPCQSACGSYYDVPGSGYVYVQPRPRYYYRQPRIYVAPRPYYDGRYRYYDYRYYRRW